MNGLPISATVAALTLGIALGACGSETEPEDSPDLLGVQQKDDDDPIVKNCDTETNTCCVQGTASNSDCTRAMSEHFADNNPCADGKYVSKVTGCNAGVDKCSWTKSNGTTINGRECGAGCDVTCKTCKSFHKKDPEHQCYEGCANGSGGGGSGGGGGCGPGNTNPGGM